MTSFMEDKEDAACCAAKSPIMSWNDVCQLAQKHGLAVDNEIKTCESIAIVTQDEDYLEFDICGIIALNGTIISAHRSKEQMVTIINAMFEEN